MPTFSAPKWSENSVRTTYILNKVAASSSETSVTVHQSTFFIYQETRIFITTAVRPTTLVVCKIFH